MKMLYVVIFSLLIMHKTFCDENTIDFKLKVSIKGNYYFVGEPIIFTVILANESQETLLIPKFTAPIIKNFRIEIEPEVLKGEIVKNGIKSQIISTSNLNINDEYITLLPNKEIEYSIDLSELTTSIGRYNFQVTYEGPIKRIDRKKNIIVATKSICKSSKCYFCITDDKEKILEDFNNFELTISGNSSFTFNEEITLTLSMINKSLKKIKIPNISKPFEDSFVINIRMISSNEELELEEIENKPIKLSSPTDNEEGWAEIKPNDKKDFLINISDRISRIGVYEIQIFYVRELKVFDEFGEITIPKKNRWESLKTTFKVVEKPKNEDGKNIKKLEEIKIIKPELLPNFKIVENIDKLRFLPLTKQHLNKFSEYINDKRIVGSAGFSNPLNLNYFDQIRICDFAAFGLETYLNGDESIWHDVPRFSDYVNSETGNWHQKLEEFKVLSISEIGRLLLTNAIENKKYNSQIEVLQLSKLLYRWLNFDFEICNRTIVQNGNINEILIEIKKWWAENKSSELEVWVVNAEKLYSSESYAKIRNESIVLNKKRTEVFRNNRINELEKLKQKNIELYNGLIRLEQLFNSPENRLVAFKWVEENKSKFLGTVFEAEISQASKHLTAFILYDQDRVNIK